MRVFLTGASSGLGEALARRYAREGATLGLFARRETELARLAAALAPATVVTYAGDVREPDDLARAGADFIARFGGADWGVVGIEADPKAAGRVRLNLERAR